MTRAVGRRSDGRHQLPWFAHGPGPSTREHRTGACDSAAASPGERATDRQALCPPPGEVASVGQTPGPARRSAGRVTWPGNAEDPEVLSCPHGRFPPGDVELVLDPADPGASGIAGDGQDRRDLGRRLPVSEAREHLDVAAVECDGGSGPAE